jgi:hypothetical protein
MCKLFWKISSGSLYFWCISVLLSNFLNSTCVCRIVFCFYYLIYLFLLIITWLNVPIKSDRLPLNPPIFITNICSSVLLSHICYFELHCGKLGGGGGSMAVYICLNQTTKRELKSEAFLNYFHMQQSLTNHIFKVSAVFQLYLIFPAMVIGFVYVQGF